MALCGYSVGSWGSPAVYQIQTLAQTPSDLGTCTFVLVSGTEYSTALQLAAATGGNGNNGNGNGNTGTGTTTTEPFDYQLAAEFWAFGFTAVVSLYLLSHVIGLVLKFVRDH
jgi:hypothetical protein